MAGTAAPSAVELRQALAANLERLEAATKCLADAQRVGAWTQVCDCRCAVDLLLDERNALRARP